MEVNAENVKLLRAPLILDLNNADPHSYTSFIDRFRLQVSIIIGNMRVFHNTCGYLIVRVKCSDSVDVELYIDKYTSHFLAFRIFGEKTWIEFQLKDKDLVIGGSRKAGFNSSYDGFGVNLIEVPVGHKALVKGVNSLKDVAEALESGGKVTSDMKLNIGHLCFNMMEGMRFHGVCRSVVRAYVMPTVIDGTIANQWHYLSKQFWTNLYGHECVLHYFEVLAVCSKNKNTLDRENFVKNLPNIK